MNSSARPTTVTVFGVLNIVFGSLGLLVSLCCGSLFLLLLAVIDQPLQVNPRDAEKVQKLQELGRAFVDNIPGIVPYMLASLFASVVLAAAMLAAGIGLLKVRPWGRTLSIMVASASILLQLGSLIYTLTVFNPGLQQIEAKMGADVAGDPTTAAVQSVIGTLAGLIYALLLLIFMFTPTVANAFNPRRLDDFHDHYERDREIDEHERRRYDEQQP